MGDDTETEQFSYDTRVNQLQSENRILKDTVTQLKTQLDGFKSNPLMICQVRDVFDDEAVIKVPNGNEFLVNLYEGMKKLRAGDSVLVEQRNLNVVRKHESSKKKFDVEKFVIIEKPTVRWKDIGGLEAQMNEVKEVIELPLKEPETFKKLGIQPPKGLLLHGQPGTGKTLLAKAVASSTNSTFIELVGSELVQKFIGEGAKLVKNLFQLAREKAPSIIFIDEIDAIAASRVEVGTSGEREVQRTFMQLLAEIDGFHPLDEVKIIGCTNRLDILDKAIMRPGRLDRIIEVGLPTNEGTKEILEVHSRNMPLRNVKLEHIAREMEGLTGADIKNVCTEAGYFALRNKRRTVTHQDFIDAVNKIARDDDSFDLRMYG